MEAKRKFGPFAALLLTTALLLAAATSHAQREPLVSLPGHVVTITETAHAARLPKADGADEIESTYTVVLRRPDEAGFERYLADLYDPASTGHRKFLTAAQQAERFGPYAADYSAVQSYFTAQGFRLVAGSDNRLTQTYVATRSQAERALAVSIVDYRAGQKRFHANTSDPSLPASLARNVEAVLGLSSLAQVARVGTPDADGRTHSPRVRPQSEAIRKAFIALCEQLEKVINAAAGNSATGNGYWSWDCKSKFPQQSSNGGSGGSQGSDLAKDGSGDAWIDLDGAGQRIGLIQFDAYLQSDVADLAALNGLAPGVAASVVRVPVNGGATLGPDQSEVLLDIGFVLPVAPGAQVRVYDGPFTGAGSFQTLFNRAIADGVTIISNSWAYCENQTSAADVLSLESVFKSAAAAGISIFNASGDSGTTCLNGSPNTLAVPASLPTATAVGGTTQTRGPGGILLSETWWDGTGAAQPTGQSGYGVSRFFARPSYQNALNPGEFRSVPDLVTVGDPNSGIGICQASDGGCPNGLIYGGTSMSAPAMAAYTALLNQARGVNLGFANPALYALAGTNAFRSPASLGVDFARAGLGSPNLNVMHMLMDGHVPGPANAARSTLDYYVGRDALARGRLDSVPADGVSQLQVLVLARDANGNSLSGKTVTLAANPATGVTITPPSAQTTINNGAAVFVVTSTAVANVTFTATIAGDGVVLTNPLAVPFVVPPAAAGGIQAFPTTVANNGTATTTITVTLQDANGDPTPGKVVTLSQGNGHSVITAPTPAVTNALGQIQFTATNRIAETVTYTAVVVTDNGIPVPGSAVVTFSGQANTQCAGAITPAAGFAVTPFATGFIAEAFPYSNVNWGCAGGTDPTFEADGSFFVSSFRTGELFKLPPGGGAASTANRLSSPGLTLQRTVFGKDGKLYGIRSATGSGFFSGQLLELDRVTGATVRTLLSNLPCPSPMAVDPLSGDLFFTGTCFGAGSDDARLFRVVNPGSATPSLTTYATLPGTPNGAITFAPDGTMFVAITYQSPTPPVLRISGTNQAQPPSMTPVPGINAVYWVNVGEALPNGAAKSLIVNTSDQKLRLADITTNPPTFTELLTTGASSGIVGPDRCLYISNGETVYRLTQSDGACGFTNTAAAPAISLTPPSVSPNPAQGTSTTVTAQLLGVPPAANTPVLLRIAGANPQTILARTDATGKATFSYTGAYTGSDVMQAQATAGGVDLVSNEARRTWVAGKHVTELLLNLSPFAGVVSTPTTVRAQLLDASQNPLAGVNGVTLQFNVAGQSCNGVTNAAGIASCQVTVPLIGSYTLTATFAGTGALVAATSSVGFDALAAGAPPCFAFNDVDSGSIFCPNVDWMRNRAITLGCTTTLYCPVDAVSRLQMAAFMNRLGTTLTGEVRNVSQQPGALDLDAGLVVCQTADIPPATFDRRILVDASVSLRGAANIAFAADAVASLDNGGTWVPLSTIGNRGFAAANHWGHLQARGRADIDSTDTIRLGVRVGRGGLAGTADATASSCSLRAIIGNR